MKYKISIVLLLALVSLLMFRTASASPVLMQSDSANFPVGTTIHVDINNTSGMEDGTSTYPFNTIQEGINAAGVDDLVGVAPGTYFEHVILKAGVELVGMDPASAIIDGSGSGIVVSMEDASLLKGFTIQHGRGSFGAGIVTSGSPTIKNNIIQNNAQTAGGAGAAIFGNVSSPLIANNVIRGNTADTQWLSGAISFINSSSPFIVNNIITDNTGRGAINLTVPEGNQPTVVNNLSLEMDDTAQSMR
jgi:serine protease